MGTEMVTMQDRNTVKGLFPCPFCGGEVTLWNHAFGTVKVVECKAGQGSYSPGIKMSANGTSV